MKQKENSFCCAFLRTICADSRLLNFLPSVFDPYNPHGCLFFFIVFQLKNV